MRIFVGAAAAVLIMTGVALAQTEGGATPAPAVSQCAAAQPAPTPPDGATAAVDEINAFNTTYQAWGESVRAVLMCRQAEFRELEVRTQSLLAQHNEMARALNATTEAWRIESEEFCARRGSRCETPE